MSNTNRLPDINEFQGHMRGMIAYLVNNNRSDLIKLLRDNGVVMNNPTNRQLITAIFVGIRKSKPFREGLKKLMSDVATSKLGMKETRANSFTGSITPENIADFVKGGAMPKSGFKNYGIEDEDSMGHSDASVSDQVVHDDVVTPVTPVASSSSGSTKKAFSDTAFGSFFNNLFSKENVNKAVSTGIDVLGQKLTANANQAQLDAATRLQVAKTEAEVAAQNNKQTTPAWVVPVIIGGTLLLVGGVILAVAMHKKKAK